VTCGPAACSPAVFFSDIQTPAQSKTVERRVWGFVDEQALYSALSKQDPPVPRFGA
jgi:hypothetical protein